MHLETTGKCSVTTVNGPAIYYEIVGPKQEMIDKIYPAKYAELDRTLQPGADNLSNKM